MEETTQTEGEEEIKNHGELRKSEAGGGGLEKKGIML